MKKCHVAFPTGNRLACCIRKLGGTFKETIVAASVCLVFAALAQAQVRITEVAPWSSGSSPVGADWFELTNIGASAIDLTGWSMDDSSETPGVAPLTGVSSIAVGQSVIFLEGDGSANATFISTWFGASAPAGFTIGNYAGSGVGLSTGGDEVSIFNGSNSLQALVAFDASPDGPYPTFDNAAGLNFTTISQLSSVGVNGAFVAANDSNEIGSPGTVVGVPEPGSALLLILGAGALTIVQKRRRVQS